MEEKTILLVEIFKALSNPLRLKILKEIREKNVCQCDLALSLKEHPVNISRAIDLLEELGIVERQKRGNKIYPNIKIQKIFKIIEISEEIRKEIAKKRMEKYKSIFYNK